MRVYVAALPTDVRMVAVEGDGCLDLRDDQARAHISGHDVLARYATAPGGTLHRSIYFDDGDIAVIA